jgi:hypothetical protein
LELFFIEEQVAGTGLLVKGRMELQVEGREGGESGVGLVTRHERNTA